MGVVYRAHDTLLERIVALKVIATTINDNPELRDRFFREARAAGQLSHRNIITIHDLGEHEGQPYLAMEFLTGEDLQRRLSRPEAMSLGRKLEIASDICDGLAYAHRRGVIHRDIKPANIFITEEGVVKILDFGLARMVASEVTASNMMLGTLNYMAPEQVRGERTDHRADIFSFGVVLYEILSGRKAFQGDSYATTLYKILQDAPEPLLSIDAKLPPEVVRIVDKTLAKPRDERYQDLNDLGRDLAILRQHLLSGDAATMAMSAAASHRTPSDPPRSSRFTPLPSAATDTTVAHPAEHVPQPRRSARLSIIVAALVLVGGISFAAWLKLRPSSESPPAAVVAPQTQAPPASSSPSTTVPPPQVSETPSQPPVSGTTPQPSAAEALQAERRTADAARAEMVRTKNAARQAGAAAVKSSAYAAAAAAEREGARLLQARKFADAAAKFYQASGLFHSAELAATNAPAAEPQRPEPPPAASTTPQGPTTPPQGAPAEQPVQQQPAAPIPAPSAPPPVTRSEPSPAPAPAPTTLPPPPRVDLPAASPQEGVRDLLKRYELALESRSIDAVKRLWPTLAGAQEDALRKEFAYAKQIDVTIESPEITTSGATATITFIRRYQLYTVDGQKLLTNSRTTVSARRVGNDWVIERVRFEALR